MCVLFVHWKKASRTTVGIEVRDSAATTDLSTGTGVNNLGQNTMFVGFHQGLFLVVKIPVAVFADIVLWFLMQVTEHTASYEAATDRTRERREYWYPVFVESRQRNFVIGR